MPSLFTPRVQVYTGDGKGKTTAAIGLAVRAAGTGEKVAIVQFDKGFDPARGEHYNERAILRSIPNIHLYPFGCERMMPGGTFRLENTTEDFEQAREALGKCRRILDEKQHFMLVCDEILSCIGANLLSEEEVLDLLDVHLETGATELVLTGRGAPRAIVARAHLVTEMLAIKHYFTEGAPPRPGIEF